MQTKGTAGMRTLGAVVAIALALAGAVPAYAEDWDVTNTPVAQFLLAAARSYWGTTPACPAGYRVLVGQITDQGDAGAAGEAPMPGYWMRLEPGILPSSLAPSDELGNACVIVTHEMGHSLGYGHSSDPTSVMYAGSDEASAPPICRLVWQWADHQLARETAELEAEGVISRRSRSHGPVHRRKRPGSGALSHRGRHRRP